MQQGTAILSHSTYTPRSKASPRRGRPSTKGKGPACCPPRQVRSTGWMEYDANQRAGLSLSTGEKKPEWGSLPRSPSDTVTCREGLADENPKGGSATRPQQALEDSRLCSCPSLICLQTFTEASPPGSPGKIARHTLPSSDHAMNSESKEKLQNYLTRKPRRQFIPPSAHWALLKRY